MNGNPFGAPPPGPPQRPPTQWMPQQATATIPDCPPGLEYLAYVDSIIVHQQVEILEAFTGFEGANRYEVKNSVGQRIYLAVERTDCCTRQCCGNNRPFEISLYDAFQREVLKFKRYLRCDSCWFPCCLQKLEVFTPDERHLGTVQQLWSVMKPRYHISDAQGNTVLKLQGPCCTCSCCGDVVFEIQDKMGEVHLGNLSKLYSGAIKEIFTDADTFKLNFPYDLNVASKACLLGAALLIDFMFFEKHQGQSNDGIGMLA